MSRAIVFTIDGESQVVGMVSRNDLMPANRAERGP